MEERPRRRLRPDDLRRLAAHELQHVGIELLRHDRRARAVGARQLEVAELRHREEDQILGEAREDAHERGERGHEARLAEAPRHRRGEAVVDRVGEAQEFRRPLPVERQGNAVARRRTERVQVRERERRLEERVRLQDELRVSRRPHRDGRGHRRLQVRPPDERHDARLFPERAQRLRERGELPLQRQDLAFHVQADVHRNLVVARAARVDLLAQVAEFLREGAFDGHVDVLILDADLERRRADDLAQRLAHGRRLLLGEDGFLQPRHLREHRHVRGGAHAVPLDEGLVEDGVVAHRVGEDVWIDLVVCDCLFHFAVSHACFKRFSASVNLATRSSSSAPDAKASRKTTNACAATPSSALRPPP